MGGGSTQYHVSGSIPPPSACPPPAIEPITRSHKIYQDRVYYFTTMSAIVETELITELKTIKRDLEYIKLHMVDIDVILTPEEEEMMEEGLREFEAGKTISLSDLKRDRGEV
jgi:hypothetical protein